MLKGILVLIFLPILALCQSYVNLDDLVKKTNSSANFLASNKSIILQRGDIFIDVVIDKPWFILNYKTKVLTFSKVRFENGKYLIPKSYAKKIIEKFPSIKIVPQSYIAKAKKPQDHVKVVILDPGHGGHDPGAMNHTGIKYHGHTLREKDIVLDIAKKVYKKLKAKLKGIKIVLTRKTDVFIPLEKRSEIANSYIDNIGDNKAIFISIHANADIIDNNARGFEVWHLPRDYDREIIDKINYDKGVDSILNTFLEDQYNTDSAFLSRKILNSFSKNLSKYSISRGIKENNLAVTRNSKMPAVLIEVGFVTSEKEAKLLIQNWYQEKIAISISQGIIDFVNSKNKN